MLENKKNKTTPIIIVVHSDLSKHYFGELQFDNIIQHIKANKSSEGNIQIILCETIEEAISILEGKVISCITPKNTPQYELTKREKEVLSYLSKGNLYKEIALKLNITLGSLKQYIHIIYKKLGVSNKTEAINKYNDTNKS